MAATSLKSACWMIINEPSMSVIGIIGGSGLMAPAELATGVEDLSTPYGECSGPVATGSINAREVVFLPRHGVPRSLAPHQVNYRANIWKLRELGVKSIFAISCVGAINTKIGAGDLVVPNQLIDYTQDREHCVESEGDAHTGHFDFSDPFDEGLRAALIESAHNADASQGIRTSACYGVTQGPRFETAAEIQRMARDGCDLVGMTLMPEAALARQLGLKYAALCPVVNMAAGCGDGPLRVEELLRLMASLEPHLQAIIRCAMMAVLSNN